MIWDLLTEEQNGGAEILSYDLWRDDGHSGDFERLFFTDRIIASAYTDLQVEPSLIYRYKYRCLNQNGWGPFSPLAYLIAADRPSKSQTPTRISFSATEITIQLYAPESTGGDDVTKYELYMDEGSLNTPFSLVQSYQTAGGDQASLLQHTLSVSADSLQPSLVYSFKFRSRNQIGYSPFTDLLRVGLAAQVQAPQNLRANFTMSSGSQLVMEWDDVAQGT